MLKTKSALECECHYMSTFIDSDVAPLPEDEILPEAVLPPPPTFDTSPRESRPSIAHDKNMQERGKKEKTTPAEFAGWMPRRMEFEVEFLNDAEQIISGIQFSETEETQASLEQKLMSLRAYNEKLEERHIRTKFAVDWNLLEKEFRSFGGRTKSEKEMEEALMPLAQIVPREKLTSLITSLQSEMRLKEQIEMYKKWRRNGIVTRDEGVLFNQLESLMSEDKLSASAVEKWNRDVMVYAESPEFRATLDRQLLSPAENQLCQDFGLSPHSYFRIKDLLQREYTARGEMTREIAVSFMPDQAPVVEAIFESMRSIGMFYGIDDIGKLPVPGTPEAREMFEKDRLEHQRPTDDEYASDE